jgi:hypothetical protein
VTQCRASRDARGRACSAAWREREESRWARRRAVGAGWEEEEEEAEFEGDDAGSASVSWSVSEGARAMSRSAMVCSGRWPSSSTSESQSPADMPCSSLAASREHMEATRASSSA